MTHLRRLVAFDNAVLLWMQAVQTPRCTLVMRALTRLGDAGSLALIVVLLFAAPPTREIGALLGMGAGLGALLAQALKRITRRRRPSDSLAGVAALVVVPDVFSFPSGHTTAAFGAAIALSAVSSAGSVIGVLVATLIGMSRVYLRAHYPLDVAAGAVLGFWCGLVVRGQWGFLG